MSDKEISGSSRVLIAIVAIFGLFALGLFYPDQFWAFHYPAFLPDAFGSIIVFGGIIFAVYGFNKGLWNKLNVEAKVDADGLWRYGVPIVAAIVFYQFPIFQDIYGDAHFILQEKGLYVEVLEQHYIDNLFSFNLFDSKIGTSTTVALVGWGSYYLGVTIDESFRWLGLFCGAGFVFFLLGTVKRLTTLRSSRLLLTLVVVGTPLVQVFCRHYEVYAPVYMLIAAFWYVVVRYYENPSAKKIILLFALVVLNIKFHITGLVLLPITLLILLYHVRKIGEEKKQVSWSVIFKRFVLPLYGLGIFVYVVVTKSVFGPRRFSADTFLDAIFLPISSKDPAPLDNYNLFGPAHFFDYFSILFTWSTAALLIVFVLVLMRRKYLQWNHPLVQISGYALLLYLPLFFVFNPLFSMPADWDIMGIPGVTFILFAIVLFSTQKEIQEPEKISIPLPSRLIAPVLALSIIGLSSLLVNSERESEARRLISIGKYQYKTYYLASSSYLLVGINMLEDEKERVKTHEEIIRDLKPFALKDVDPEYAQVITRLAAYYRDQEKDMEKAVGLLEEAYKHAPMLNDNVYELVITHFILGDFKKANEYVPDLVVMQYPDLNKALRVAIHTSIEAGAYADAEKYCVQFLEQWPEDKFILKVLNTLQTSEDKGDAVKYFRQS